MHITRPADNWSLGPTFQGRCHSGSQGTLYDFRVPDLGHNQQAAFKALTGGERHSIAFFGVGEQAVNAALRLQVLTGVYIYRDNPDKHGELHWGMPGPYNTGFDEFLTKQSVKAALAPTTQAIPEESVSRALDLAANAGATMLAAVMYGIVSDQAAAMVYTPRAWEELLRPEGFIDDRPWPAIVAGHLVCATLRERNIIES